MSHLTTKQRQILSFRFGLEGKPQTLRELGQFYNVSHESIRAMERRALRKIDLRRLCVSCFHSTHATRKLSDEEKEFLIVLWGIADGELKDYKSAARLCRTTVEAVFAAESKALANRNRC